MRGSLSFQRTAAVTAIVSGPLAYSNMILGMMAVDFNFEVFENMRLALDTGTRGASLFRWSLIADMFGYYLLIIPLAIVLWQWLKPRDPGRVSLFALCLISYSLIGAIGAAILAAVWPPLIEAYSANAEQAASIAVVFDAFTSMVYVGLWNILEEFLVGVGLVGFGLMLRSERRAIGNTTLVLGVATLVDSIGTIIGLEAVALPALYVYLILAPIWATWFGIDLLRRPVPVA